MAEQMKNACLVVYELFNNKVNQGVILYYEVISILQYKSQVIKLFHFYFYFFQRKKYVENSYYIA